MYSATANLARVRVSKRCRWYISFFRVAKNDSAAALSQQTPVRPTLVWMWLRAQNVASSAEVYWVDSTGRRNTSSVEVFDGSAGGVDEGVDGQVADEVAGQAV